MSSSPKPWSFSTYTDADGRTYVYGYRNRWDPEKKQSRIEKRCHVGRLDPQTGQVHLGRKFLTNNPEYAGKFWLYDNNQLIEQEPFEQPDTDNEPQPSWRGEDVELGLTWAAWQFAVDHGLLEDLQETFGEDTGTELLRFAIYRLCGEDSGMMNYADWLALVWLPQAQPLSSQRISEQLAVVDQSLMDRYFKRRHDRLLKARQKVSAADIPQFLALDSTSISTYSETIASAAYGHARQDPHLRQVNLSLGVDYETGDVCYAYESEGSTNDKQLYLAIVQRMIDHQFDLSNTVLVTDRGYHSLMNMQKLINLELKFVQGVTRAEDSVRRLFDQHRVSLDDPAFTDGRLEVAAYTTTEMWQEDGAAGRQHIHNTLHLYQDGCLRAEQKRVFLKNLDETIDRLNQGKKVDSEQLREMHRYLVKKEPQHWMRNAAAVAEACRYMGNFVIRTNVVQDPFIALSIYRARNIVEQSFQQFKNQTAGDRLYATSSTYMGKLFVQVLAQSLRLMMRMACRRNETATNRLPNNSLTKAFMQLRYLKANKPTDRNAWKTKEIPKKIRDLFTLLGLPLPTHLNYGLPALHFESPRWFRKLEQFKTAPTRGRNTVPDPSVGVVSFMSPHKRQFGQQPVHGIPRDDQLCLAVFHLFCTVEHHHPQGGSDRAHQKLPLYRNGADTQTITIEPIFQLIEILLNHPALPINGKRFKRIGNAVASKSKIPRRFDRLIDFA